MCASCVTQCALIHSTSGFFGHTVHWQLIKISSIYITQFVSHKIQIEIALSASPQFSLLILFFDVHVESLCDIFHHFFTRFSIFISRIHFPLVDAQVFLCIVIVTINFRARAKQCIRNLSKKEMKGKKIYKFCSSQCALHFLFVHEPCIAKCMRM